MFVMLKLLRVSILPPVKPLCPCSGLTRRG
jgi:hypothetical protein